MRYRRVVSGLVGVTLAAVLSPSCEASKSVPECERLEDYSCHCFPLCQLDYNSIIDSQDPQACNQAIADAYEKWRQCEGSCTVNCEYAWGTCALSHYRQVGKNPGHACGTAGKDAGSDGG